MRLKVSELLIISRSENRCNTSAIAGLPNPAETEGLGIQQSRGANLQAAVLGRRIYKLMYYWYREGSF